MSVDTDAEADVELDDLERLGRELGEAIEDLPEYEAFEEASRAVEASDEAQEQIREFERQRQEFMLARKTGQVDQEDVQALQEAQNALHGMPVMAEFLEAREELIDRLEDVNRAISEPLSIDFGKEAGGCCHDEE